MYKQMINKITTIEWTENNNFWEKLTINIIGGQLIGLFLKELKIYVRPCFIVTVHHYSKQSLSRYDYKRIRLYLTQPQKIVYE